MRIGRMDVNPSCSQSAGIAYRVAQLLACGFGILWPRNCAQAEGLCHSPRHCRVDHTNLTSDRIPVMQPPVFARSTSVRGAFLTSTSLAFLIIAFSWALHTTARASQIQKADSAEKKTETKLDTST